MTSISNLLIHDDTTSLPILLTPPPKQQPYTTSLPPIHGDDPPRKLTYYHDTYTTPPPQRYHRVTQSVSPSPPERNSSSPYQRKRSISSVRSEELPTQRKRGRPPTFLDTQDDQLTFLTPTVWNIPTSQDQKQRELNAKQVSLDQMNDSMTAFTSSNMDTVLYMPRKKRGRKPKTFVHGNSCFIWKDLTSTRSK